MIVVAHTSHWVVNLAFALPAIGFIVWLGWVTIKAQRQDRNTTTRENE